VRGARADMELRDSFIRTCEYLIRSEKFSHCKVCKLCIAIVIEIGDANQFGSDDMDGPFKVILVPTRLKLEQPICNKIHRDDLRELSGAEVTSGDHQALEYMMSTLLNLRGNGLQNILVCLSSARD
jgi:hypothetical protein